MAVINWGTSALTFTGAQRVYVRQRWVDDWELQPQLWCEEATWSLLPAMPSAMLSLRYGRVIQHGATEWSTQSKLAIGGWYVKIEFDAADGMLTWVGFIDQLADEQGGITAGIATGTQRFVAQSMAQILAYEFMTRSKWHDEPNTELRWSGSAITFNQGGKPNRTDAADAEDAESYVFCPTVPKNWSTATPWTKAKFWTSRNIAEYLIAYATPVDSEDEKLIPFRIDNIESIPDWDRPTLETEGKSILAILEELVNASRLLQFSTLVDESESPAVVVLKVHSLSATALSLPDSETHPANNQPLQLITVAAHDTNITTQASVTSLVNQVVVKGSKRETCFTAQVAKTAQCLLPGWNTTEEDAYNDAASGEAGYGALSTTEQKRLNQVVRSRQKLNDVFKTFVINPAWDFVVSTYKVFENTDTTRYFPWWNDITVSPSLPLKEGIQYEVADVVEADHRATVEYRPPYVLFKRPATSQYLQAEKMADGVDPKFAVSVGLAKDNNGITLDVNGERQDAIATVDFIPLAVDDDKGWNYYDAKLTISLTEDRFIEYAYPTSDDLPGTIDAIRRKIFYAGDAYKKIIVLPDTAVDVDNAGAIEGIDISNIESGGFGTNTLIDDSDKLESIGKIAAAWYLVPRQILRLSSARPTAAAAVGMLIQSINASTAHAATINTVVSEIRLSTPLADRAVPVSFSLTTAMGELDPLQFLPPAPIAKIAKV